MQTYICGLQHPLLHQSFSINNYFTVFPKHNVIKSDVKDVMGKMLIPCRFSHVLVLSKPWLNALKWKWGFS